MGILASPITLDFFGTDGSPMPPIRTLCREKSEKCLWEEIELGQGSLPQPEGLLITLILTLMKLKLGKPRAKNLQLFVSPTGAVVEQLQGMSPVNRLGA